MKQLNTVLDGVRSWVVANSQINYTNNNYFNEVEKKKGKSQHVDSLNGRREATTIQLPIISTQFMDTYIIMARRSNKSLDALISHHKLRTAVNRWAVEYGLKQGIYRQWIYQWVGVTVEVEEAY